jgi:hypothetical protein
VSSSHCGLAIYSKKKYLKAKEELWKLKIIHHIHKYNNLPKNPLEKTKILQQDTINSYN